MTPPAAKSRSAVARSEVNGKRTITVAGVELVLRKTVRLGLIDIDDNAEFLRAFLPEDEMQKLWDIELPMKKPLRDELDELITTAVRQITEVTGLAPGESEASS